MLYDLPNEEDVANWRPIKVLISPIGLQDVEFDSDMPKEVYFNKGYKEVEIGVAPERTQSFGNNIQAKRKQYGLKHHVTSTIHAAMGDTLHTMATEVSRRNGNFKMWDKGQMIVILSRTELARNAIFVGDKNETIDALKHLSRRKTQ